MYWSFYVGTTDPNKQPRDSFIFFFCMEPKKLINIDSKGKYSSMMDDIDDVSEEDKARLLQACEIMDKYPNKVLVGPSRLKRDEQKGRRKDQDQAASSTPRGIDLEVEILGELPGGRYEQSAVMNFRYLDKTIDEYNRLNPGQPHSMSDKRLMLMWVRVPDTSTFEKVAQQIGSSPEYTSPAVKCETASSGIASFLDAYKDLLFGMRWLAGAGHPGDDGAGHRQRHQHQRARAAHRNGGAEGAGLHAEPDPGAGTGRGAVYRLSQRPVERLVTHFLINDLLGGIALPIAFFGKFYVEDAAPWWGLSDRRGDGPGRKPSPGVDRAVGQGVRGVLQGGVIGPEPCTSSRASAAYFVRSSSPRRDNDECRGTMAKMGSVRWAALLALAGFFVVAIIVLNLLPASALAPWKGLILTVFQYVGFLLVAVVGLVVAVTVLVGAFSSPFCYSNSSASRRACRSATTSATSSSAGAPRCSPPWPSPSSSA